MIPITGYWEGFYVQYETKRPISARLRQQGLTFTGTMIDQSPRREMLLDDFVLHGIWNPAQVDQIKEVFVKVDEDAPIVYFIELPIRSILSGKLNRESAGDSTINSSRVQFLKTYCGKPKGGFYKGKFAIPHPVQTVPIQYQGELSDDGQAITGQWQVRIESDANYAFDCGDFVLNRVKKPKLMSWLFPW